MENKKDKRIRQFYYTSKSILIIAIIFKIVNWQSPNIISLEINNIISILLISSGFSISIYQLLLAFEPLKEEPNWEIIFPELKNDK